MKRLFALTLIIFIMLCSTAWAQKLVLMLDWFPNVDHTPIYVAQQSGYFTEQGIEVEILAPSETSDALKLAAAGQVDLAVSYEPQTIMAADAGLMVKTVSPLVVKPLATLMFLDKSIKSPADLSGKKIGYTVPGSEDLLLKGFADINGITDYTPVNVGFTILPALVSKQVAAVMGPYKTYETVTFAQQGADARFFELEKYGIPEYEELIFTAGSAILEKKEKAIRGFVLAIHKALADIQNDPDKALAIYLDALPEVDKETETKAFALTAPNFAAPGQTSDPGKWQAFIDFALKYGLIKNRINPQDVIHNWDAK
ncbi:ABC transporter substrate-binding protein [Desulfobacter sp.]|uniref:ABC transporter substrate-binding protein n=1 Tax=Desulfobacter sp. TaxID=2294 RepID=UPI000E9A99FC|nr:ABC transporter substrate-binding protein [Desulfobacter sp.]HBT89513.1 ABC transporter substrate-binding protein [Desulfobacter sp.]